MIPEQATLVNLFQKGVAIKAAPMFGKDDKASQIENAWGLLLVYLQKQEQRLAEQDARISELERMVSNGKG